MDKVVKMSKALEYISKGTTIMVGGFLGLGAPHKIINAIIEKKISDLHIITADTAYSNFGVGKLIANKLCKNLTVTHVGTNECTVEQINNKEINATFVPQGSFVRKIRCGGSGIGGFLTKVGLGTLAQEGKTVINFNGEDYIIEEPLHANVCIIGAYMADKSGNVVLKGTQKNYNIAMAMAADIVIVEASNIVECGQIDKECIHIPFIFVDYIVQGGVEDGQ